MRDLNTEHILYPILGIGGATAGCLLLYYLVKKCYCKNPLESMSLLSETEDPERYIIFLDIDGSTTFVPGDHPQSLFALYMNNVLNWSNDNSRENIIKILFQNRKKFEYVRSFIQTISSIDPKKVEIVITTNNFKDAIKQLWSYCFKSPWSRLSPRSAFRESGSNNKINLINNYLYNDLTLQEARDLSSGKLKAIYFEDDKSHLNNARINGHRNLCVIDCSNDNWLGTRLQELTEINQETCLDFLKHVKCDQ